MVHALGQCMQACWGASHCRIALLEGEGMQHVLPNSRPHAIQAHADTSQLARTANHALPLSAVHSESLDRSLLPFQSSSSSEHPVMCLSASPPLLRPHAMRDSHVAWRAVGPARSPRTHSSSCQAATSAKVQRGVKSRLASARAQLLMLRHV